MFHPEKYSIWLETLPENSKKIFMETVLPSSWY